jgi:D-alanyl-D-alanine carboxypeptidase
MGSSAGLQKREFRLSLDMLGAPAVVLLAIAPAAAQPAQPLPDTPAGRFVSVFLDAYNSSDAQQLERYNALYGRKTPPQDWIDMYAMTGRLSVVRVEPAGPNEITVLLEAEHGDAFWKNRSGSTPPIR